MDIFFSKFLPILVYPLGLACLLILLGILFKKKSALTTKFMLAALILLWLAGNHWVSYLLARSLEWQNLPASELPQADVIVILGGGTEAADYPRSAVEINSAGDRVLHGAHLYKQGAAPHILVSGSSITWMTSSSTSPAQEMTELLVELGVPDQAIWQESQSLNTYENALYCAQFLKGKGINRIILVTSALHFPRAKALFEYQGLTVIPAPTDFTITQKSWDKMFEPNLPNQIINLLPNSSSLSLTTNVLKEYIGILVSGLRGQLSLGSGL